MTTESAAVCTAKVVNEKEAMDERLIAEELPGRQLDGPLDNAQLYAECRRLAAEQAALRRVAALVARGVEPSEVFDPVVKDVRRCLVTERVAASAGDAGLRTRVLQSIEVFERERPTVPLLAAVAQHSRGILERDADALVGAANALRRWRPVVYPGAGEDAGGELSRTERNAEAIDQFNAAFDTYMEHEAVADARRAGRELRRLGVQRRIVSQPRAKTGWDSLTDSELRVVNLIAQGVTNRDVVAQLHLSLHTVKNHVHNAFAKLGINSRAQLTQLMPGSDCPAHHIPGPSSTRFMRP
jgi:DNA-binding CsgD family transcriptional regulator